MVAKPLCPLYENIIKPLDRARYPELRYIIAFVGVALWFVAVPWKRSRWDIALMIFAFILTSLSPSDLFPKFIRKTYVQPYALKALPVVLIWFKLIYEMMVRNYSDKLKE